MRDGSCPMKTFEISQLKDILEQDQFYIDYCYMPRSVHNKTENAYDVYFCVNSHQWFTFKCYERAGKVTGFLFRDYYNIKKDILLKNLHKVLLEKIAILKLHDPDDYENGPEVNFLKTLTVNLSMPYDGAYVVANRELNRDLERRLVPGWLIRW